MTTYLDNCPCGSKYGAQAVYDNHGIFVFFSCNECDAEKRRHYNPVIFNNYQEYESLVAESGERFEEI